MGKLVKLDDEGNPLIESAMETTIIKVDGQDVEVPQSAAQILEKAEHDLKSRNERALREGRESLSALLSEDTLWYSTHPSPELWEHYEPKVNGGKGFTGDPTMLNQKPEEKKVEPTPTAVDDTKLKAIEAALAQTRAELAAVQADVGKSAELTVVETRNQLAKRYPNADIDAVTDSMRVFFTNNQRHPAASEVEALMKRSHDFVSTKIEANKPVIPSGIPPVVAGGSLPPASLSQSKTPHISDVEAWKALAHADNVHPG